MKFSGFTYSKPAFTMKPKLTLSPTARYGRPAVPSAANRATELERINRMEAKPSGRMGTPCKAGASEQCSDTFVREPAGLYISLPFAMFRDKPPRPESVAAFIVG